MNGWELLALCILSPQYMTPEKIQFRVNKSIPLIEKRNSREHWITDEIADEIKAYCKIWTQKQCAEDYGISYTTVNKIVNGVHHKKVLKG